MGSIADKLNKLRSSKADIKDAILSKGVEVGDELDTYGDAIRRISGGGSLDYSVVFKSEGGLDLSVFSSKSEYPIIVNPPYTKRVYWTYNGVAQTFPLTATEDMIILENIMERYYGDGSLNPVTGGYTNKVAICGDVPAITTNSWKGNTQVDCDHFNSAAISGFEKIHGYTIGSKYANNNVFSPLGGMTRGTAKWSDDGRVYQTYQSEVSPNANQMVADSTSNAKTIFLYNYAGGYSSSYSINSLYLTIDGSNYSLRQAFEAELIEPLILLNDFAWSPNTSSGVFEVLNLYNNSSTGRASYTRWYLAFVLKQGHNLKMNISTSNGTNSGGDAFTFTVWNEDDMPMDFLE